MHNVKSCDLPKCPAVSTASFFLGFHNILYINAALSHPCVLSELRTYKAAPSKLYSRHEAVPVCFEVSRNTGRGAGGHASGHVQVVPVPGSDKRDGVGMEETFKADISVVIVHV